MKRAIALVFAFVLTLCEVNAAETGGRLDRVQDRGVLRVGTTGDYKPFSYRDPATGQFVGLDIELAGELAKALGVKLELVPTTWPSLMKDFEADRFDIGMSGISITLERQKKALFSRYTLKDGKTPITRCENLTRFQTLEQIDQPGTRLIVNPGGTNERFLRANIRQGRVQVYPDNVTIFDEIVAGRADLMITDAIEARLQQRLRPQLCAVHPEAPFDYSEKAYLLPRDLFFKAFVDQWVHQLVASGAYGKFLDKWLAYPWNKPAVASGALPQLLALMKERLALGVEVARSKWNSGAAIEDLPREREIAANLARQASQAGLPADWAEHFFRAQIEASKAVQRELHERWRSGGLGKFADAPDLARDVRPKLDALTPKLLAALAAALPELCGATSEQLIGELQLAGIGPTAATQAASGLDAVPGCK